MLPKVDKRREVVEMTAFEIVMVIIGIAGLIISANVALVSLLSYISNDKKK